MPMTTTTPVEIKSDVVNADVWRISGLVIGLPNSGTGNTIDVIISAGITLPDSSIEWVDDTRYRIENVYDANGNPVAGQQYFDDIAATLTSGMSVYDEHKAILYAHAQSRGWVPAAATAI